MKIQNLFVFCKWAMHVTKVGIMELEYRVCLPPSLTMCIDPYRFSSVHGIINLQKQKTVIYCVLNCHQHKSVSMAVSCDRLFNV